jgi:hypothetical protein
MEFQPRLLATEVVAVEPDQRSGLVGSLAKITELHSEVVLASGKGETGGHRSPPACGEVVVGPGSFEPVCSMTGRRCTGSNSNR